MLNVSIVTEIHPVYEGPPVEGLHLPPGLFRQIKHDYEALDNLVRIGMPSVLSMYLNQYCELTKEWQVWWFQHMIHAYTGYEHWDETKLHPVELGILKAKWRSLTKSSEAFTNFKGTNEFHDYITPNSLQGNPGQEPLACTGNVVKIMGAEAQLAGARWYPIETLDGSVPPPPIEKVNRLTRPDLIPCATNVPAIKPSKNPDTWSVVPIANGTWRVDEFPQLAPQNTPFPLRTNGKEATALKKRFEEKGIKTFSGTYTADGIRFAVNYIKSLRLKPIAGNVLPSPYNPPK